MSTIPPNWMASVLGTPESQRGASAAKQKEAADQAEHTNNAAFAQRLQNVIDNTDRDGEVYADAEGLGSQGRAWTDDADERRDEDEQEEEEESEDENEKKPPGGSVDLQA